MLRHRATPRRRRATTRNLFVINLCASTTPVALTPPDHAGLKRFNFFVSRRREEGRERFRLHMGYFESQEEAEKLLDIVREIYPGAWAGLSPGQRLRARAQAQAQAAADAPTVADTVQTSQPFSTRVDPLPEPEAPAVAASKPIEAAVPAVPAVSAAQAPPESVLALVPDQGRRPIATDATANTPAGEHEAAALSLNNVRAAIASLDDTGARAPTLVPLPELKAAAKSAPARIERWRPAPSKSQCVSSAIPLHSRCSRARPIPPATAP